MFRPNPCPNASVVYTSFHMIEAYKSDDGSPSGLYFVTFQSALFSANLDYNSIDKMSPYETYKHPRSASEHALYQHSQSVCEPHWDLHADPDNESDDAANSDDSDYVPNEDEHDDDDDDNEGWWESSTSPPPGFSPSDFSKQEVTQSEKPSQSLLSSQVAEDKTLGKRQSHRQISQVETRRSNSQNPSSSRPSLQQRISSRHTHIPASTNQRSPVRSPPMTVLTLQARDLSKLDRPRNKSEKDAVRFARLRRTQSMMSSGRKELGRPKASMTMSQVSTCRCRHNV